LPQGTYTLKFGGALPITGGTFFLDITYYITVKNGTAVLFRV